jgi:hypothetical protein
MILKAVPRIAAPRFSSTSNREDLDCERVCLDMRIPAFFSILILSIADAAAPKDESRLEAPARQLSAAALPDRAKGDGVRFVDLNGDGYDDIVVSNDREYGVYLYVPKEKEKKNLQWFEGWTQVLREGKAGDANSLPVIRMESVAFGDGAMWVREGEKTRKIAFAELLKVPGPAPLSPTGLPRHDACEAGLSGRACRQRAVGGGPCLRGLGREGPHVGGGNGRLPIRTGRENDQWANRAGEGQ